MRSDRQVVDRRSSRGISHRPFDFYVAFLVTFFGAYGLIDPTWPEFYPTAVFWVLTAESVYLTVAGVAVMTALIFRQLNRCILGALNAEWIGWAFIASAALVIILSSAWIPTTAATFPNPRLDNLWLIMWAGLSIAAAVRAYRIRELIRRGEK